MQHHYYDNNIDLESKEKNIVFDYKGMKLSFISDNGVFSKNAIDYGSRVLLDMIEINDNDRSLLDVGCGYGPMGISLAKVNQQLVVDMVDVNERALSLATRNKMLNMVESGDVFISDCYSEVVKTYDIIISNPPIRAGKEVVHSILSEAKQYLNDNGSLWVVIQKKQGAPSAMKKMEEVYGNCEVIGKDKGYYILKSIKKKNY